MQAFKQLYKYSSPDIKEQRIVRLICRMSSQRTKFHKYHWLLALFLIFVTMSSFENYLYPKCNNKMQQMTVNWREHQLQCVLTRKMADTKDVFNTKNIDYNTLRTIINPYITRCHNDIFTKELMSDILMSLDRQQIPFFIVMYKLMNLRHINEQYGHWIGTGVIRHVIEEISKTLSTYDIIGYWYGNEYMILAANETEKSIEMKIQSIHSCVLNITWHQLLSSDEKISIQMSFARVNGIVPVEQVLSIVNNNLRRHHRVQFKQHGQLQIDNRLNPMVMLNRGKPLHTHVEDMVREHVSSLTDAKLVDTHMQWVTSILESFILCRNTGVLTPSMTNRLLEFLLNKNDKTYPLYIGLLDVDNFNFINRYLGRSKSDEILRNISRVIENHLFGNDVFGLMGGDEFLIIFSDKDLSSVEEKVTYILNSVSVNTLKVLEKPITISTGLTKVTKKRSIKSIIDVADGALYDAKRSGKNRIQFRT